MGVLKRGGKCAAPEICNVCPVDVQAMFGDDVKVCCVCGEQPAAYWRGERVVAVCATCAVEVLPKLIADAVVGPTCGHKTVIARLREAERRAKAAFWEAAACAIAFAEPPLTPKPPCPYAAASHGLNGKATRN